MNHNVLNWFFWIEVLLFGLIITGVLPREAALYLGVAMVVYFLVAPLDDSLVFFVRSIPLFLALPLTAGFDNFNVWRILAVIVFLKWAYGKGVGGWLVDAKTVFARHRPLAIYLLAILFLFAALSVIPASDKGAAAKRIVFFLNAALVGVVIYHRAVGREFVQRLIKNSVVPVAIVAAVGYIQIASTYFVDIYRFMSIWGEGIQCRQFGEGWCNIAVWFGNTWFAYYGEQLSLRVFSLFPDSHSFPQFVLLGIPAVIAVTGRRWARVASASFLFLIVVLSGTRGIWAASVGVALLAFAIIWRMRRTGVAKDARNAFQHVAAHLVIFFLVFSAAFPILSSPQFLLGKDGDFLETRLKSIVDFGETSNAQRVEIWKKTLASMKKHPLLGIGIGNYPVVLGQDIRLAKAGSSAHNLYLHIAAEMGIPAAVIFIGFLWLVFKKNYGLFMRENDNRLKTYFAATLLFVPWVLLYSLTDVAIFDERALLFAVVPVSIIFGASRT